AGAGAPTRSDVLYTAAHFFQAARPIMTAAATPAATPTFVAVPPPPVTCLVNAAPSAPIAVPAPTARPRFAAMHWSNVSNAFWPVGVCVQLARYVTSTVAAMARRASRAPLHAVIV